MSHTPGNDLVTGLRSRSDMEGFMRDPMQQNPAQDSNPFKNSNRNLSHQC